MDKSVTNILNEAQVRYLSLRNSKKKTFAFSTGNGVQFRVHRLNVGQKARIYIGLRQRRETLDDAIATSIISRYRN